MTIIRVYKKCKMPTFEFSLEKTVKDIGQGHWSRTLSKDIGQGRLLRTSDKDIGQEHRSRTLAILLKCNADAYQTVSEVL